MIEPYPEIFQRGFVNHQPALFEYRRVVEPEKMDENDEFSSGDLSSRVNLGGENTARWTALSISAMGLLAFNQVIFLEMRKKREIPVGSSNVHGNSPSKNR